MKMITVKEFAKLVGFSHDTITRMLNSGKIRGIKKNPFSITSPFMIPTEEVARFKKFIKIKEDRDMAE
jgi:hypothetical protein